MKQGRALSSGFTISELIIVIIVIAILASISLAAYQGIQQRAARISALSDIRHAAQLLAARDVAGDPMPEHIEQIIKPSPGVVLSLVNPEGHYYYGGISPQQNGLLFHQHCANLVAEGYGNGPSDYGAGTVAYISSCTVYDTHYLQINGWNGGFNVSNPAITQEQLQAYVDTAGTSNPGHPSYKETLQHFMDELVHRFTTEGGSFPITSFWQPWQTTPTLPQPEYVPGGDFCIIATHQKYPSISYVSTGDNLTPKEGSECR